MTICGPFTKPLLKQFSVPSCSFVCCKAFLCIWFTCFYIYERETDLLLSVSPAPSCPIIKSVTLHLLFSGSSQLILLSSVSTCLLHRVKFSTPSQAEASYLLPVLISFWINFPICSGRCAVGSLDSFTTLHTFSPCLLGKVLKRTRAITIFHTISLEMF